MDGPVAAAGAALALTGAAAWAVRGRSSSVFGPSIHRGPVYRRAIALTFDDGPSESTPQLQSVLDRHHAKATFFQCGMHARRLPHICRDLVQAGHEVANHTDSHPALWLRSPRFIFDEMSRAQAAIHEAAGVSPALFRAPYGVRWPGLRDAQRRLNLLGVMWTAIGLDWKLPPPAIVNRLVTRAENGAIFCLHDGRGRETNPNTSATLEAVRLLLPQLADKGYQLVTVSDLLR